MPVQRLSVCNSMAYTPIKEVDRLQIIDELKSQADSPNHPKDIAIVIRDGLEHVVVCLESVWANTENCTIFLWDNGSKKETKDFLLSFCEKHQERVVYQRSDENLGFIVPNNILVSRGTSPFVILLNSDVVVKSGWDEALIGYLHAHDDVTVVGYQGGLLGEDGVGIGCAFGSHIDYVSGWCMAFRRQLYEEIGLFDADNLKWAYGEDSDFCLRVKEAGKSIYALHLNYVLHMGGATMRRVMKEMDVRTPFLANHSYLRRRWHDYLEKDRILLKGVTCDG